MIALKDTNVNAAFDEALGECEPADSGSGDQNRSRQGLGCEA